MRGVSGFNDELGRAEVVATCTSCHNTPNVGTNSEGRLTDIGVSDASRVAVMKVYRSRGRYFDLVIHNARAYGVPGSLPRA